LGGGGGVAEDGAGEVLCGGEACKGGGDVQLVENGRVAPEGDEAVDYPLAERGEDALFFGADAETGSVEALAEGGPFGEVEGARGAAGGEGLDGNVGGGAGVFAFDVGDVPEAGGPAESERGSLETGAKGGLESVAVGEEGGESVVEVGEGGRGGRFHDEDGGIFAVVGADGGWFGSGGGAFGGFGGGAFGEEGGVAGGGVGGDYLLGESHDFAGFRVFELVLLGEAFFVDGGVDEVSEGEGFGEADSGEEGGEAVLGGFVGGGAR
jgi:hypothetical protein